MERELFSYVECYPEVFDLSVRDGVEFAERLCQNQRFGGEFGNFETVKRVDERVGSDDYGVVGEQCG